MAAAFFIVTAAILCPEEHPWFFPAKWSYE
jgi:hypothetical protein